jgi:hypothetical protein
VTLHSSRHTTASLLFASGKNIRQVQEWLGHSSLQLTRETYVHLLDDGLGEADFLDSITAVRCDEMPANRLADDLAPIGRRTSHMSA